MLGLRSAGNRIALQATVIVYEYTIALTARIRPHVGPPIFRLEDGEDARLLRQSDSVRPRVALGRRLDRDRGLAAAPSDAVRDLLRRRMSDAIDAIKGADEP